MFKLSFLHVLILFLTFGCMHKENRPRYIYPQNTLISKVDGSPINDSIRFLPVYIFTDSGRIYTGLDSTIRLRRNELYTELNQPVLYNYYLGHNIYRFIGSYTFERSFILTLHVEKANPHIDLLTMGRGSKDDDLTQPVQQVKQIDSNYSYIMYKPISVDEEFCKKFEKMIDSSNFWNLIPYDNYVGLDGTRWLIEAHLKNRYWFHSEWSPKGEFLRLGEFLLNEIYHPKKAGR